MDNNLESILRNSIKKSVFGSLLTLSLIGCTSSYHSSGRNDFRDKSEYGIINSDKYEQRHSYDSHRPSIYIDDGFIIPQNEKPHYYNRFCPHHKIWKDCSFCK